MSKELIKQLIKELLKETPIEDITRIGDFSKRHSIVNPVDRALLSSPKAEVKIRKIWENTPGIFNLVFINDPRVKGEEFKEVGVVDESFVRNKMKISEEELQIDPSACTIIYTNNSGDERIMASGWILGHRLAHSIARENPSYWSSFIQHLTNIFKNLLNDVYGIQMSTGSRVPVDEEKLLRLAAEQIGTMKSARDSNLRSWYEFAYEIFTHRFD